MLNSCINVIENKKGANICAFFAEIKRITMRFIVSYNYLITLATTPAPTVRPPSRIAKRKPSAIAIG